MAEFGAHSADVQMQLLLNGYSFSISHLGPGFIRLEELIIHEPANAEIVLIIDGVEDRWAVKLPAGITTSEGRIPISKI